MSIFNGKRLQKETFRIDSERMRIGWYSDAYFPNTVRILKELSKENYVFEGKSDIKDVDCKEVRNGDIRVEMQFFTRRKPFSIVAGVDEALAILQECTGYFDATGNFVNTYDSLEIEAVQDGTFAKYYGDPMEVQPVLKVRGRYRDFAILETPILGVLTETTRIATNVYNTLVATKGKDILFFPARFAHYKLQAMHGYAYSLAVEAYNQKHSKNSRAMVSTNDQGGWWGGKGGGTIAHASIACFLGDTAETMMQFARIMPMEVLRIALIDYHNDCVGEVLTVMRKMFARYLELYREGKMDEAAKYKLYAVRPDTSGNMRDESIEPIGDRKLDCGVNPRLVWKIRKAMDKAYKNWRVESEYLDIARKWCEDVKIVATGGFTIERINQFEQLGVPVDIYGIGSSLLDNSKENDTNNDYTADIVRVEIGGEWRHIAKTGRRACDNPSLETIK
ncbi:MAG TPA: nicotinate phosphoribosyltransferase [Clostridia bacterium]|nr:nicotinate phosphoribosyltransferase [Clostridia bacterium]